MNFSVSEGKSIIHPTGREPVIDCARILLGLLQPSKFSRIKEEILENKMDFLSRMFGSNLPATTAQELSEKLKSSDRPMVVDVRQPEEYREGHIAGSKLIPLGELPRRLKELPQAREIVCVCASGSRSRSATKILMEAGYKGINMNGGMFTWQRSGLPVKKGTAS